MEYCQAAYEILNKANLAKNCYDFTIHCPEVAELANAGQFAHVKASGFALRRPISICEIDKAKGNIRLVFEVRGEGTEKISELTKGSLIDIIAPLGKGFTLFDKSKKAVVIGGGIGTPPMLALAEYYGENATAIIGFRSADAVILKQDFIKTNAALTICTEDGSVGERGYVTTPLAALLDTEKPDIIYACGPHMMLRAVVELAQKYDIRCEVSLEERMGCGVGACLVCACKTVKDGKEYYSHVCKDGPVFSSKEVVFE